MIMIIISITKVADGLGDTVEYNHLRVSFLDQKLVEKLCQSYGAADSAYQSYSDCGLAYFRRDMAEAAFLEFGGALQICHFQVSKRATRSWQWATRMVESTNKLVVTLNEIRCQDLIATLLEKISNELHDLLQSEEWGQGEDLTRLNNWCTAMHCKKRQQAMANLYKNHTEKMVIARTQH